MPRGPIVDFAAVTVMSRRPVLSEAIKHIKAYDSGGHVGRRVDGRTGGLSNDADCDRNREADKIIFLDKIKLHLVYGRTRM